VGIAQVPCSQTAGSPLASVCSRPILLKNSHLGVGRKRRVRRLETARTREVALFDDVRPWWLLFRLRARVVPIVDRMCVRRQKSRRCEYAFFNRIGQEPTVSIRVRLRETGRSTAWSRVTLKGVRP
jgi:hypothetical protein